MAASLAVCSPFLPASLVAYEQLIQYTYQPTYSSLHYLSRLLQQQQVAPSLLFGLKPNI